MRVLMHFIRNNDCGVYSAGETQSIEVGNLEACFKLSDNKILVIDGEYRKIYDNCELLGMEEIK